MPWLSSDLSVFPQKKKQKKHKHKEKEQKKRSRKEAPDSSSGDSDEDGEVGQVSTQELLRRSEGIYKPYCVSLGVIHTSIHT